MSTRVYVPSTWSGLWALLVADGLGPPPLAAHAVTDGLRTAYADGGEEEWEYAAAAAAARASVGLLAGAPEDPPRRVVVAVDAEAVRPLRDEEDPTAVEVLDPVPLRRVAAVLVDSADAEDDVRSAVDAWAGAGSGDPGDEATLERCLDRELGWWATQEIGHLLEG